MKRFLASFLFLPVVVIAADTNELPALIPAYGELPPTFWEQHQAAIIVAGFAVLAFAFYFLKVMLRPESPLILPPEAMARQALANLQDQPEDGKTLTSVSQILRRYVVAAFALPPAETTTAEFCAVIEANERIGSELAQSLSSFLRECDVRKFSPANNAAPLNAVNRARVLVSRSEAQISSRSDATK
jgi:hypothetical protein